MKDIFIVRVNIDTLRRKCGLCLRAEDKAALLDGFMYAASGGEVQPDMPARWQDGFAVGAEAHARAKDHQSRMSSMGQKSANLRSNLGCNVGSNVRSNQAIKPSSHQASKPESQEADASPLASLKKSGAHMTRKGESIAGEWERLLGVYPIDRVKHALSKKAPKDKWPSQVRSYLEVEDSGVVYDELILTPEETMAKFFPLSEA